MFFGGVCFQVVFLSISDSIFGRLGFQIRGFRIIGIARIDFPWKLFLMNFGIDFYCFLEALGAVFLVFQASKIGLETRGFFFDVTDPEPGIWWGESPRYFGMAK